MGRLEKEIIKKGEYLGEGIHRVAYLFQNKVYKFANGTYGFEQTEQEKAIYEIAPPDLRKFFPNPGWVGRVMVADYVKITKDFDYDLSPFGSDFGRSNSTPKESFVCDNSASLEELLEQSSLGYFINYCNLTETKPEVIKFLQWATEQGLDLGDLINNTGNFGVRDGQIKFVDWGL